MCCVATLVAVLALLFGIYPLRPASLQAWIALFLVAAPLYLSVEYLESVLFSKGVANAIPSSITRVLYGVGVMLVVFCWDSFYSTVWSSSLSLGAPSQTMKVAP